MNVTALSQLQRSEIWNQTVLHLENSYIVYWHTFFGVYTNDRISLFALKWRTLLTVETITASCHFFKFYCILTYFHLVFNRLVTFVFADSLLFFKAIKAVRQTDRHADTQTNRQTCRLLLCFLQMSVQVVSRKSAVFCRCSHSQSFSNLFSSAIIKYLIYEPWTFHCDLELLFQLAWSAWLGMSLVLSKIWCPLSV